MKGPKKQILQYPSAKVAPSLAEGKGDISNIFTWAFCVYFLLIPIVALFLTWGYSSKAGQTVTQDRIRFISVNAITLSGFEGSQTLVNMPPDAQVLLFLTTVFGGLFTLYLGGIATKRILGLVWPDSKIFYGSLWVLLFSILFGVLFMGSGAPGLSPFMAPLSAFTNSGLMLNNPPAVNSWKTLLVLTPLSFFGGLGIVPLIDLLTHRREKRELLPHTGWVLALSAIVYLAGLGLIFLSRWVFNDGRMGFSQLLSSASVQAINTRAAGINYEFAGAAPRATQWVYLLLMSLGAGPGSFAGGFGLTTLLVIVAAIRKLLKGENPGKAGGAGDVLGGDFCRDHTGFLFCDDRDEHGTAGGPDTL